MAKELGSSLETGGFARLHKLSPVERIHGGILTKSRSLRGISDSGPLSGIYDVTQEMLGGGSPFMVRYTLVSLVDGVRAVYENGRLIPANLANPIARMDYVKKAERLRQGFDQAGKLYVIDPELIILMDPTDRALRELYRVSENDLDTSGADSITYGIFGDSR